HPEFARGRRDHGIVVSLLGDRERAAVRLLGSVEVGVRGRLYICVAELRAHQVLPKLDARRELGLRVAQLCGALADTPRAGGGSVPAAYSRTPSCVNE